MLACIAALGQLNCAKKTNFTLQGARQSAQVYQSLGIHSSAVKKKEEKKKGTKDVSRCNTCMYLDAIHARMD